MKNIFKRFSVAAFALIALASCEKDETKLTYSGGTAPTLAMSTTNVPLNPITENEEAVRFNWTNPNYQFSNGISSQDVRYILEIDTVGKNFASKYAKPIVISRDLGVTYSQKEFNNHLGNIMRLPLDKQHSLEARVLASIGNTAATQVISNVVKFTATPFAPPPLVPVPTDGTLWAVGNAFASGWNNPLPAPFDVTQKFTAVTKTRYELVVDMIPGGNYKLIQTQGVWGTQYHMISGGTWDKGTFEKKDAEPGFNSPPDAGKYKLVFDFQLGEFNVTKQ